MDITHLIHYTVPGSSVGTLEVAIPGGAFTLEAYRFAHKHLAEKYGIGVIITGVTALDRVVPDLPALREALTEAAGILDAGAGSVVTATDVAKSLRAMVEALR